MTTGVNLMKLFFFVTNALMRVRKALQPSLIFVNKFINLPLRLSGTCGLYYKNLEHYLLSSIGSLAHQLCSLTHQICFLSHQLCSLGHKIHSYITFIVQLQASLMTNVM